VIWRLTNFYPLITNAYYDLKVNINEVGSTESIFKVLQFFFNYLIGFGIFFIAVNTLKKTKDIIISVIILLSSTTIATLVGVYQFIFDPLFGNIQFWLDMGRLNATFTDPNSLGVYTVMLFPLFLGMILFSKKWYVKLIISVLLIPLLINIFISGSRTAFLGIIITSTIFLFIGIHIVIKKINQKFKKPTTYKKFLMWIAVIVIIVLIIALLISFLPLLFEKNIPSNILVRRIGYAIEKLNNAVENRQLADLVLVSPDREVLWDQAINMFKDYPISGVGSGAFTIELPNYYVKMGIPDYRKTLVDFSGNYYLQFLSELGLPGLILILAIFFIIIRKVCLFFLFDKKNSRSKGYNWLIIGLFISFISMAIALIFGPHTDFNEIQLTFWLIIALLLLSVVFKMEVKKTVNIYDISKTKFDVIDRIAFSVIIILFTVSFATASFEDLSINIKQNLYGYMNRYGYYDYTEKQFKDRGPYRWLTSISSDIVQKEGDILFFWINGGHPDVKRDDLYVRFYIDNTFKKITRLDDREWHYIELKMPDNSRDKVTLTICVSRTLIPREWNVEKENKDPGIMITNREFKNDS
jgi:O-antigen ligase